MAFPIRFILSGLFSSSVEILTGSSRIIPSTTHTGSLFPVIEEDPLILILGAAPGVDDIFITATPGRRPCNILSIDRYSPPIRSAPFIEDMELANFRLSIS